VSFEDFVRKHSRLSPRPGYYAGRGPLTDDLNSDDLEKLWSSIRAEIGDEAARNFVMMVEELEDMSATAFLWSFMRYWPHKRWTDQKQEKADGVTISGYGDAAFIEAEVCVMNVLSDQRSLGDQRRQSEAIKRMFLDRHSTKSRTRYSSNGFGGYDYEDRGDFPWKNRRY
jgi:hypothetical protein